VTLTTKGCLDDYPYWRAQFVMCPGVRVSGQI